MLRALEQVLDLAELLPQRRRDDQLAFPVAGPEMSVLAQRLLAIDSNLAAAGIPHAFGGAIALAYCTGEPRATIDLDINVFLPHDDTVAALAALPTAIQVTDANRGELATDGQTRLWWETTPVDLFFDTHPFHRIAASGSAGSLLPTPPFRFWTAPPLAVFKAMFDRTKDWADLEAMSDAGQPTWLPWAHW